MKQSLVSIVIPVYNAAESLERCLDSILCQTIDDWEAILIDDGSTDSSLSICERYASKDGRFHVIHKQNGGVSSARNVGLDNISGEWVTFVDSDDYVTPDFLYAVYQPRTDLVITECFHFMDDMPPYLYQELGSAIYDTKDKFLGFMSMNLNKLTMLTPWAKFYKKDLISTDRFLTGQKLGEDTEFFFRYLAKIESAEIAANGAYYYYDIPSHKKYNITLNEALKWLNNIHKVYEALPFRNSKFESMEMSLFCYTCREDLIKNATQWFNNHVVRKMYKNAKLHFDTALRLKYELFRLPYFFRIYHLITGKWV